MSTTSSSESKRIKQTSRFGTLYGAYCISCIGDRLWAFGLTLFLERLGGIRLVVVSQLIEGLTLAILSSFVGNWLDHHNRKCGVLTALAFNNISVVISASSLLVCFSSLESELLYTTCLIASIFACSVACLAGEGERIAFTKDWIVVLTKKESSSLSEANAVMKTIDLVSAIFAPFASGLFIRRLGHRVSSLLFVVWNLVSWGIESILLACVYDSVPELAVRHVKTESYEHVEPKDEIENYEPTFPLNESNKQNIEKRCSRLKNWMGLLAAYKNQEVFFPAFGLALLYMTVLGFDGIAVAFARSQGFPEDLLGAMRGFGSFCGVCGTLFYTFCERRIGVRKTGFLGLIAQQSMLITCVVSIWLPGSPFAPIKYFSMFTIETWWQEFSDAFTFKKVNTSNEVYLNRSSQIESIDWSTWTVGNISVISIFTLLLGISLARFGLYMGDLSITQLMQETVPEIERSTIFGIQNAISECFDVIKNMMVIVLPDSRTFGLLIIASVTFVGFGFICYSVYFFKSHKPKKTTNSISSEQIKTRGTEQSALIQNHEPS